MLNVFTNGCFDLLHIGHVSALQQIKNIYSNSFLTIGLNSDNSVSCLKGADRPIIAQESRRQMLLALRVVDDVIIFDEPDPLRLIQEIKPDIIIKGIDYHNKEVIGYDVANIGVTLLHFEYEMSTSAIIKKIKNGK